VAASSLRVTEYSLLSPFRTIVTFAKLPASTCRGGVNPILLVALVSQRMAIEIFADARTGRKRPP
jgi:hypothetical protein